MSSPLQPCAACGYRVHAPASGDGSACPVCGWVDDFDQLVHPDLGYGANAGLCLRQAQARAAQRLADDPGRSAGFERDARWRPLRADETPPADPAGPSSPVCYVGTPDRIDFVPYWRRGWPGSS
jgi:hypothetical protein